MQTQIALLQADKLALDIARSNEELAKSKAEKLKRNEIKKQAQQHKIDWN